MSFEGRRAVDEGEGQPSPAKDSGAADAGSRSGRITSSEGGDSASSLTNPITTPSLCSTANLSRKSSSSSLAGGGHPQPLGPPIPCGCSPRLSARSTPNSYRTPPRGVSSLASTPDSLRAPALRVATPDSTSRGSSSKRSSFRGHVSGDIVDLSSILRPRGAHASPKHRREPRQHQLRLATWTGGNPHQQVEPYARRKADPQGYLFTCFLDYSRCVRVPPVACFDYYVRPESLQYSLASSASSYASACDTPRSSASSFAHNSTPLAAGRLYSRPPTPPPLIRAKEVHRIAMAGAPVDVKELSNCYLFVVEVPGLKNTDVKVQVENDSILKISGERKREDCDECDIKYVRVERQAGKFQRKFNLPANANLDSISAACQDGLLSVVVPKNPPLENRRPKNFDIKIGT